MSDTRSDDASAPPSSVDAFNGALMEVLRAFERRCPTNSEEGAVISAAITSCASVIEAMPSALYHDFRDTMTRPQLLNALRSRDVSGVQRECSGTDNLLAVCIAQFDVENAQNKRYQDALPWQPICALYKHCANIDVFTGVPARVHKFNEVFLLFLEDMCVAFPPSGGPVASAQMLLECERALHADPSACVYGIFRARVKQLALEHIRATVSTPTNGTTALAFVQEIIGCVCTWAKCLCDNPDTLLMHLPFIRELPVREYWKVQIEENAENSALLSSGILQLVVATIGLPPQLFSMDTFSSIFETVQSNVKEISTERAAPLDINDQAGMVSAFMRIIGNMRESGQLTNLTASLTSDVDDELLNDIVTELGYDSSNLPPELAIMLSALEGWQ